MSTLPPTREAIVQAYHEGYTAGAMETRERILKAASGMEERTEPAPASLDDPQDAEVPARVERGAIRRAVQQALAARGGFSAVQITKRVSEIDPRITSNRSVSNELNRNEGSLYERRGNLSYRKNAEGPAAETGPSQLNGSTDHYTLAGH